MQSLQTVSDIMTREVVSVHPQTPLFEAAKVLNEHSLDGVPVVDGANRLVGILTEYDLISKGSALHLPTLQKVFESIAVSGRDHLHEEVRQLTALTVNDVMNTDPLALPQGTSIEETVRVFTEHHRVNPVPVVDPDRRVVGVVSRYDLVKLFRLLQTQRAMDNPTP